MPETLKDKLPSFYPSLLRTAERITTQRADAEDLVQDTLVKALERLDQLKRPEALAQWLYLIMLRLFASQKRKESREAKAIARCAEEQQSALVPSDVSLPDLVAALGRLTPKQREAVLLAASTDLPQQELADKLGISLESLRSRFRGGRAKLQSEW